MHFAPDRGTVPARSTSIATEPCENAGTVYVFVAAAGRDGPAVRGNARIHLRGCPSRSVSNRLGVLEHPKAQNPSGGQPHFYWVTIAKGLPGRFRQMPNPTTTTVARIQIHLEWLPIKDTRFPGHKHRSNTKPVTTGRESTSNALK